MSLFDVDPVWEAKRKVLEEVCRGQQRDGATTEDLIAWLRSEGCSKVDTIQVLAHVLGTTFTALKEVVHTSPTWADRREIDDDLHDKLRKVEG